MIQLKTLLKEKNSKSNYDMIMDLIGEFLELKDGMETRMNSIEEILNKLKPRLDDRQQLNPMDIPGNPFEDEE